MSQITKEELEIEMNKIKEVILSVLVHQEYLDIERATEFLNHYAIIVRKKGWLGKFIDKFRGNQNLQYQVIALIDHPFIEQKEEPTTHLKVVPIKKEETDDPTK